MTIIRNTLLSIIKYLVTLNLTSIDGQLRMYMSHVYITNLNVEHVFRFSSIAMGSNCT